MSRVGRLLIPLPKDVTVEVNGDQVRVHGPKGELQRELPEVLRVKIEAGSVRVERSNDQPKSAALHGLMRALIANMVKGVSEGFQKELSLVGVGYRAAAKGAKLELQVGYSHPVEVHALPGITFETPDPTRVIVKGIDNQAVGQASADIRSVRPPEPYKGKGIRYLNEKVRRKTGKQAAAKGK